MRNIERIPTVNSKARDAWLDQSAGALTRLLGRESDHTDADYALFAPTIEQGHWPLGAADRYEMQGNALLALLSAQTSGRRPAQQQVGPGLLRLAVALAIEGCDPLQASDSLNGADAVDLALALGSDELLQLWGSQIDYEQRGVGGQPWLHQAAEYGITASVRFILQSDACVDQTDEHGRTALFKAIDADMVALLVEHGAAKEHCTPDGLDALTYWQRERHLSGEDLAKMQRALGKVERSEDPQVRLSQFLELSRMRTVRILDAARKRLDVDGSGRNAAGEGVVCVAVARVIELIQRREGRDRAWARDWLVAVSQWPQAMNEATDIEIGMMRAAAKLDLGRGRRTEQDGIAGKTAEVLAATESTLAVRGVKTGLAERWGATQLIVSDGNAPLFDLEDLKISNTTRQLLVEMLLEGDGALQDPRTSLALERALSGIKNWEVHDNLAALATVCLQAQAQPCSGSPLLLYQFLRLGIQGLKQDDAETTQMGELLLQVAEKAATDGCPWNDICDSLQELANTPQLRARLALVQDLALDAATFAATVQPRRGVRL